MSLHTKMLRFILIVVATCLATMLHRSYAATNETSLPIRYRRQPPAINYIKECTSIDIRNGCESMHQLDNCTVITGYLVMALLPNQFRAPCAYENFTFPALREITEFMIFYEVRGLKSLRDMFPNLTVIRGKRLFLNYAFGMTNMPELRRLEFKSLVAIQRGHVYLGACPKLCQIEQINWDRLTLTAGENQININNVCYKRAACFGCETDYCWSDFVCQRFENDNLAIHQEATDHCHPQCLGGCYNETSNGCVVCRGITDNGECVKRCPIGKYLMERYQRCYTRDECIKKRGHYTFGHQCVPYCPTGYKVDSYSNDCMRCNKDESCISVCLPEYDDAFTVYNLAEADNLRGCQIVNGSLIIAIRNLIDEENLIRNFASLREIRGHLKIYRSNYLTSLNFLRNLQRIHGDPLENDHYALILYDNKNIRELWKPADQLEFMRGGIYMHRNNKLCNQNMRDFQTRVIHDKTLDTLQTSDQEVLCGPSKLNLGINSITHHAIEIYWLRKQTSNEVEVIYRVVPPGQKRVTESELDAPICTRINWERRLIFPHELQSNETHYNYRVEGLTSFTRYAILVRTFGADYKRDARSDLTYETTLPNIPTPPYFDVINIKETSILLRIPLTSESKLEYITHHMLNVYEIPDDTKILDRRNFCKQPQTYGQDPDKYPYAIYTEDFDECCVQQAEYRADNSFVKGMRDMYSCKLDRLHFCTQSELAGNFETPKKPQRVDRSVPPILSLRIEASDETVRYNLTGLKGFQQYSLQLQTCNTVGCSSHTTRNARTNFSTEIRNKPKDLRVCQVAEATNKYYVRFSEPAAPNGLVVYYVIHYRRRLSRNNYTSHVSCITAAQHREANFLWIGVMNESFLEASVRVHALAGTAMASYVSITQCTQADLATNQTVAIDVQADTGDATMSAGDSTTNTHLTSMFVLFFFLGALGTIIWIMYKRRCWRNLPCVRRGWSRIPRAALDDHHTLVGALPTVHFRNNVEDN